VTPLARRSRTSRVLAGSVLLLAVTLTGCSGSSSAGSPSGSAGRLGVTVSGKFGEKPTLTIPKTAAPTKLFTEVLSTGTGDKVASGEVLVANYLGETWDLKDGKPNVFDNSFDRKSPLGFPIGVGQVIKGWDQALVGQTLGSRVLLGIPADLAYGATPSQNSPLAGHALVFVVDLVDTLDKDMAATGAKTATPLPAGLPKVTSEAGKKPVITSVAGVKPVKKAISALLLTGSGEPIDETKSLAMQSVQTDAATGKQTQETWGKAPQIFPAAKVLPVIEALKGQRIGSRAIALAPPQSSGSGTIVIVDVVGQY
jgi:peptidylprolyl isomerase